MIEVVWTEPALLNLQAIRDYLQQFNPYAAAKVAAQIVETGNNLSNFAYRGRIVPGTTLRELASAYASLNAVG